MLIKIIITCTYAITGLTVASHPQKMLSRDSENFTI